MFDKRNRWIINVVMAIAAVAFLGLLVAPFLGAFQSISTPVTASPTTSPAAQQEELEAQARGYELVLQREPGNQTALRGLLEVRIRQGNVQGAIAPLEKLAELNPEETNYTILLAQARQRLGDREGSAQAYRSILKTQPGNIEALQGFVDLMLEQKRPEAAVGLLQDTLRGADNANKAKPGSIDVQSVQLLLGRVYALQQRLPEAIAIYDQAIQRDVQDFRPVLGKAIVLQQQGQTDTAKPLFEQAAALAPAQYKDQIKTLAAGPTPTPGAATAPATPSAPNASPNAVPTAPSGTSGSP